MKKLLIGIFTFLIGFISFSSADLLHIPFSDLRVSSGSFISFSSGFCFRPYTATCASNLYIADLDYNIIFTPQGFDRNNLICFSSDFSGYYLSTYNSSCSFYVFDLSFFLGLGCSSSSSDITVFYNNGQTASIACNGDNIITIDGLSTMSSLSTFTPYFNINYVDYDNQVLTESYSNNILYLSGGQFQKTYTGGSNNDWILNLVGGSSSTGGFNIISSGLVVSGDIVSDNLSGNIFKNFIDTGFTVLFSNIPSYIQYVILIAILILILRAFTKKRRKF